MQCHISCIGFPSDKTVATSRGFIPLMYHRGNHLIVVKPVNDSYNLNKLAVFGDFCHIMQLGPLSYQIVSINYTTILFFEAH